MKKHFTLLTSSYIRVLVSMLLLSNSLGAQTWRELNGLGLPQPASQIHVPYTSGVSVSSGNNCYVGTGCRADQLSASSQIYFNSFHTYNATSDSWSRIADFPIPRANAVGFILNGDLFVGLGNDLAANYNDLWDFDSLSNVWTQKANFPGGPRTAASAFSISGMGYVVGGLDQIVNPLAECWQYNPLTNLWTQKNNFAGNPRFSAVAFSIGSNGYFGLGNGSLGVLTDFWEYNSLSDSWTPKSSFPQNWYYPVISFPIGSNGYVHDKYSFWQFDPAANQWNQKSNVQDTLSDFATGFSGINQGFLLYVSSNPFGDYRPNKIVFQQYDPVSDSWSIKFDTRESAGLSGKGVELDGKAYVGGKVYDPTNQIWQVDTSQTSWIFSIGSSGYGIHGGIFQEYNTQTGIWTPKANFPQDRIFLFCIGADAFFMNYYGTGMDTVWAYNTLTDTWSSRNVSPFDLDGTASFSIGNKGYLGTGWDDNISWSTNAFYEYDPVTDIWTPKASVPGQSRENAVGISSLSRGYIGMGDIALTNVVAVLRDFYEYNPLLDQWDTLPELPGRLSGMCFSIRDTIYVGGAGVPDGHYPLTLSDFYYLDTNSVIQSISYPLQSSMGFSIFPNPAKDKLYISVESGFASETRAEIIDLSGRRIRQFDMQTVSGNGGEIQIGILSPGIYFLRLTKGENIKVAKFVISE